MESQMTQDDDLLNPDHSPTEQLTGVRRVNNVPVYILGGLVLTFLIVMMVIAMHRAELANRQAKQDTETATITSSQQAEKIIGGRNSGLIQSKQPEPPKIPELPTQQPDKPELKIARVDNLNAPPPPPLLHAQNQQPDPTAEKIKMLKQQLFFDAVKSPSTGQYQPPKSKTSNVSGLPNTQPANTTAQTPAASADPLQAYRERLAKVQATLGTGPGAGGVGGASPAGLSLTQSRGQANDLAQFEKLGQTDRWTLESEINVPATPFLLRAPSVIPGVLISGINSDLPGTIIAQTAQNVFDTATGKHLLIPLGSRLFGRYASEIAFGQNRVFIVWQRIVYPDGKALDIGAMPGADSAGYAGFEDQVNHHFLRIFGSALILSAVTAGPALTQNNSGSAFNAQNSNSILSQQLGQQLGQATAQLIQRNLSIPPTIEIRPGYRFNLIVVKDIALTKPYQAFDY